ncbi:hypothetical protein BDV59DRAFT_196397 [Aspergillus ambiguus]|uniref:DUF3632 domain-containing protein n=1 Tax=Aspergillus ambiguus TaxID=176160 RepID=UPI003CCCF6CF
MDSIHLHLEDPNPDSFDGNILRIVEDGIQQSPATSAKDAAHALDAVYTQYMTQNPDQDPEGFLLCFWELLCSFASQVSHDDPAQDKLVAIIKELTALPSRTIIIWQDECKLWSDMPLFDAEFPPRWKALPTDLSDEAKKQKFLNIQAYAARILGQRLTSLERHAIWALSEAVEGAIIPVRGTPDIASADPTAVEDHSCKVAVAAVWVIHAGRALFGRDEDIPGTHGGPLWALPKKEAAKLSVNYRGTQGLCDNRWKLWKDQFCAIRDCELVDVDTREIAGRAVLAMEGAEQG